MLDNIDVAPVTGVAAAARGREQPALLSETATLGFDPSPELRIETVEGVTKARGDGPCALIGRHGFHFLCGPDSICSHARSHPGGVTVLPQLASDQCCAVRSASGGPGFG